MRYAYATLFELREYMQVASGDTGDDTELTHWLLTASQIIDLRCKRRFDVRYETIYHDKPRIDAPFFSTIGDTRIESLRLLDDLITLVAVINGDLTSIASTNFVIEPANIYPKNLLKLRANSGYSWEEDDDGESAQVIGVTGWWGFHKRPDIMYVDSYDSLKAAINSSATSFAVNDYDGTSSDGILPRFQIGQIIKIDSELMLITSITTSTNTLGVVRAYNGSTAASHLIATAIYIYRPLENIKLATILYALWRYRQSAADNEGQAAVLESDETIKVPPKIPRNILDLLPAPKPTIKG